MKLKEQPVRITSLFLLGLGLASCISCIASPPPEAPRKQIALPGPSAPPPAYHPKSPEPLPVRGLESMDLSARELSVVWEMLTQLYAPCAGEAVSLRECIEESRACGACVPAAQLLAAKVKDGSTPDQLRQLYGVRFGPNVKQVDVADSPARGPEDAPVTIVVWSDFQCPHCRYAMPLLEKVFEKHTPRVRLVHKFYPLRQHTHAEAAARAAIAAKNQGHYWEMERALFDHQSDQADSDLQRYAQDIKLDMKRWAADLGTDRTSKILERDHADAERAGLSGTPFILINGREFDSQYFHLDTDLDAWVKLEIELSGQRR